MPKQITAHVWATEYRCPRCGSVLLTTGYWLFCSFIGDRQTPACAGCNDYRYTPRGMRHE